MRSLLHLPMPVLLTGLIQWFLLASAGHADLYSQDGLKIFGDLRTRLEADFDSRRENGEEREDRNRLRIRLRLGLTYAPNDRFSFGLRLRSGSTDSQQSPHITVFDFDDNDRGDADFHLDRWYAKFQEKKFWAWAGRNGLPLFRQNELFWDDDVTPLGLAFGWKWPVGNEGSLAANLGFFSPPVGMKDFAGDLRVAQLVWQKRGFTAATSLLSFEADAEDPDAFRLLRQNGLRDYTIWVGTLQVQSRVGSRPLRLGGDVMHNAENYSPNDPNPFTAANHDQDTGFVLSAQLGQVKEKGDWLVAWFYARIETFAVNASYAQDDWARWGSATENRSSNFKGHEFRFTYALEKECDLVLRLYLVDSITTQENGSRFRFDFNYRF